MMAGLSCEGLVSTKDEWFPRAACRGRDVDMFFVHSGEDPTPAIKVCIGCEVKKECLQYAIDNGISHGIWGAKTPRERRAPGVTAEPTLTYEIRNRMWWMHKRGWSNEEIGREFGVCARTVTRVLQRTKRYEGMKT